MMKTIVPGYYSRQKGLSLIGLLIGLLISVLCILGSLTLYKNLIQVATESKLDSNHDGQLASAMLIVQLEVQSAGFGIEPDATTPSIVINNPEAGKTQLLWRFFLKDNLPPLNKYQCRGLHEEEDTTNGVFRVLKVIKVVDDTCDESTPLENFTWETDTVLGRWRVLDDGLGLDNYITTNGTMFNFQLATNVKCNPYGANTSADDLHAFLTISVPGSAHLQGATGMGVTQYEYCLTNIHYPAPP